MNDIVISTPTINDIYTMWKWGNTNWQLWSNKKFKWYSKKALKEWILHPKGSILLVAKHQGELVGMCLTYIMRSWAYCDTLFIQEEYRGKDIGKKLLTRTEELLKQYAIESLSLLVNIDNADGINVYKRLGFISGYQLLWMDKPLKRGNND